MDVTLEDVLARESPRHDLRWFQVMAIYIITTSQVPLEILCDRSFVFSYSEMEYVDRAARFFFGTVDPSDTDMPLSLDKPLYTYPLPGSEVLRAEVTKGAAGFMRLMGRVLWPSDLLVHRRSGSHEFGVTPSPELASDLTRVNFVELPPVFG